MGRDRFVSLALATAGLIAAAAPVAAREGCSPEALGVSRTITISNAKGAAVGLQSYPQTLALQDHEVILTFDDGPAGPTAKVLDALKKECARATFFIIGRNAEETPALVRRAAKEGHSIGHHSYSHPSKTLRQLDPAAAQADVDKGIAAVTKAAGGDAAPFFRFPGFADTPALRDDLIAKGYTIFGSDIWASDWSNMSPKAELDLVLSRLEREGKGIVLFHDSKAQTANMLPDFLSELKQRGYRLVHMVPGDGDTPIAAAGPGWKSTTEPIIARTLGGKSKSAPHKHDGADQKGHTHDFEEPAAR